MRRFCLPVVSVVVLAASVSSFVTPAAIAAAPVAVTLPTSGVSNTVATLNGTVNPGGAATTTWFEWGVTANSQRTTNRAVGSGVVVSNLTHSLTGLTAGIAYYARVVASNSAGVVRGQEVVFGSPSLSLNGPTAVSNYLNNPYADAGASAVGGPLAVAAGYSHSVALRCDGRVSAWGGSIFGQLNIPASLSNVVAIAAGDVHTLGVLRDGTIAAWGNNTYGQINTPAGLSNMVSVAGGGEHSLALRNDGMMVAWGAGGTNSGSSPDFGQSIIPAGLSNVVAIAAGQYHSVALRRDGTAVAWGNNGSGQTNVPAGLSNVVSIAAGDFHNLAVRSDGTVAAWGAGTNDTGVAPNFGQALVPIGLSNVVAVAGGYYHSVALRSDGTVVAWGSNSAGQTNVPTNLSNVVAIAAGANYCLVLRNDGSLAAWGDNGNGQITIPSTLSQALPITLSGSVNVSALGTNVLTYTCTNVFGGVSRVARTVVIVPPLAPSVTNLPATGIANGFATLNGMVNPNGAATTAYFQYGLTTNYGSFSATNSLPATNTPLAVASVLSGLAPLTTYHFRLVASNSAGSASSSNLSFTTSAFVPLADTLPASGVSNTTATLRATVNPRGAATTAWFEYGFRPNFYTLRTTNRSVGSGVVAASVTQAVAGLTPGLVYHGRVVASNSVGLAYGDDTLFGSPAVALNGGATITNALNSPYVDPGLLASEGARDIAAGSSFTVGLRQDGTVAHWGYPYYGLIDIPAGLDDVTAIAAGRFHILALRADGTVTAWGAGRTNSGTPPEIGQSIVPPGLSNVVAVAGGDMHSLALREDGTVVAWGYNNYGQATVPANISNVVAIAGGQYHSMVLRGDGTVAVWGQPGSLPTQVPAGLSNVVAIASGTSHCLAVRSDGTVAAWGITNYGVVNVPAGLSNVVAVAGGYYHSLALRGDGTVVAWGAGTTTGADPHYGQSQVPAGLSNVVALAAGDIHSVALRNDGTIVTWGSSVWGEGNVPPGMYRSLPMTTLGSVTTNAFGSYVLTYFVTNSLGGVNSITRTVVVAPGSPSVATLSPGVSNTVAKLNGTVNPNGAATTAWFEWGTTSARYSQRTTNVSLGNGGATLNVSQSLTGITPGFNYHGRLVASNSVGVMSGADILFGSPAVALVGDTTVTNFLGEPFVELGASAMEGAVAIAAGDWHSLAVRSDGTVVAWGQDAYRQSEVPAGLSNVVGVAAGQYHSMALREDGTLVIWGYSGFNITTIPPALSNVVAISAGGNHNLALQGNGIVAAWGENGDGQSTVPAGLSNVVAISAGTFHNLALRGDGTVAAWGRNDYGQSTPTFIDDFVVAVAGGGFHSLALQRNGFIRGWGRNTSGQRNIPSGLEDSAAIGAGFFHSLAARSDGTVDAWGEGGNGQTIVPAGLGNVVALAGGQQHSIALRSDGTIAAWGVNSFGITNVPASILQPLPVTATGTVTTNVAGTYVRTYRTTNSLGGIGSVTRTVIVAAPPRPVVTTLPASDIANGLATLNGTVNPNGAVTKAYFRYGLTTNYGSFSATNTLAATNAPVPMTNLVSNLLPLTTYHFRLVASNSGGVTNGADLTFTTPSVPSLTSLSAAVIATNGVSGLRTVQLSAFVNPNGLSTTVSFQYGLSANYLAATSPQVLVGSSRVDLQACKLEYSIVSPK